VSLLTLVGCSNPSFYSTPTQQNVVQESWFTHVNTSPNVWIHDVDPWFLTGEPNQLEQYFNHPFHHVGSSVTQFQAGSFNRIIADGSFQVQIIGGQSREKVYVLGPYDAARQISIQNRNQTLYIIQPKNSKINLSKVIVRIGVCQLNKIINRGKGNIYGRHII